MKLQRMPHLIKVCIVEIKRLFCGFFLMFFFFFFFYKIIADKKSHENMYLSRFRPVVLALQ